YGNAKNPPATRRIVWWVESDLKRLAELIKKYEIVSSGEKEKGHISPIPSFYRKEFGEMVSVLFFYGMLDSDVKIFFAPD
ncbi:hypothetical protein, partial [Pseudomonas aeruginosa]|uniref:hypothetical protein n=1 Tax=Pseudomonas aeruginosa TaxID=287 RepID=UPI00193A9333